MRFRAFATDYDGTLARRGKVAEETVAALATLRDDGVKLVLVTGREMEDLRSVFPQTELFDLIVAENGAVLCRPQSGSQQALAAPPPAIFCTRLRERGVDFATGIVIVATTRPFERETAEALAELGLDLSVIYNKNAVMILPRGVHKGTGLDAALSELGVEWQETMGVGDAENDLDFLSRCGYAVATGNALQVVQDKAQLVADENGAGVREAAALLRRLNGTVPEGE
ncbi:Cof-type HAD-IIB family hydrolase [Geomonas sp. RF6]|uniref:HAD family hydrolase n=1 Tax=Geomonas sp. RF6 TaxID=2897342 RepID=UPI001E61007D|nr:HAD family hydrolase [Geomonas sp. RF6]UFS71510.1 Cof-type HAD-IIB family hydrolase [Geomonas sp. RF6]